MANYTGALTESMRATAPTSAARPRGDE